MNTDNGSFIDLKDFKTLNQVANQEHLSEELRKLFDGARPVFKEPDGKVTVPEGKSLAEMNEVMKAAGWTRAERRRYLAKAKKDGTYEQP